MSRAKIFGRAGAVVAVFSAFLMVSGCGDDGPDDSHTHSYGVWGTVTSATCQVAGQEKRTCSCGDTETRSIPKLTGAVCEHAHTWGSWVVTTPATCNASGVETRTCSCGDTDTRTIQQLSIHNWDNWVVTTPATCDASGAETRTCQTDASHTETRDIAKLSSTSAACVVSGTPTPGDTGRFTDQRDQKSYRWVKIGTQTWMAENLNYDAAGSECYRNSADSCAKYGRLYDWATVMNGSSSSSSGPSGVQGICPSGWHVPSDAEWTALTDYVGGASTAGTKLKAKNSWNSYFDEIGTDDYGFSALPGGISGVGMFLGVGISGDWWSATETELNASNAWIRNMHYSNSGVNSTNANKAYLRSLRCVRD